jgi:thioredoxin-like negative regulator of GroEL
MFGGNSLLKQLSQNQFSSPEGEKASVLLAECYLRDHKRAEAQRVVSRFLEYYSKSVYRERMEVASAVLKIENKSVYEGLETLLRVLTYTKIRGLRSGKGCSNSNSCGFSFKC